MKSLEIVRELIDFLQEANNRYLNTPIKTKIFRGFDLGKIEQDLEVLEILKKYLGYSNFIRCLVTSNIDIAEFKKVMKWMEENKNEN